MNNEKSAAVYIRNLIDAVERKDAPGIEYERKRLMHIAKRADIQREGLEIFAEIEKADSLLKGMQTLKDHLERKS